MDDITAVHAAWADNLLSAFMYEVLYDRFADKPIREGTAGENVNMAIVKREVVEAHLMNQIRGCAQDFNEMFKVKSIADLIGINQTIGAVLEDLKRIQECKAEFIIFDDGEVFVKSNGQPKLKGTA